MFYETDSNSIGTVSEITAIMPIKQGFVDKLRTTSYATRLRGLLYTFNGLRKASYESRAVKTFTGPTEALQTLHSVRWMLIEQDSKLLLSVDFDSPWEPYIRRITEVGGPILDVILCHCEGYEAHSTDFGYKQFAKWVKNHQEECEFFYSASPDLTVDDLSYLRALERYQRDLDPENFDQIAARLRAPTPQQLSSKQAKSYPNAEIEQGLRALAAFFRLKQAFDGSGEGKHAWFLWRATHRSLGGFDFLKRVDAPLKDRYKSALDWAASEPTFKPTAPVHTDRKTKKIPAAQSLDEIRKGLQGNVLTSYQSMTHGCLILVRYNNGQAASDFLKKLHLTIDGQQVEAIDSCNSINQTAVAQTVAFTHSGLRRAGVPKEMLGTLPKEFRDGMESRAAQLGDLGANHPDQWELPLRLVAYDRLGQPVLGEPVRLSSVDFIISLQCKSSLNVSADHLWSTKHPLYPHVQEHIDKHDGIEILAIQSLRRPPLAPDELVKGHFGLTDGISQPIPKLYPKPNDRKQQHELPLGELLLGYKNDRDDPVDNDPTSLFYDGCFQVIRKLSQNVDVFDSFITKTEQATELSSDIIKAKMLGRWPDGQPTHLGSCTDNRENDFDFADDPQGEDCPLHSHIRRANPRRNEPNFDNPRILRRGFMYGPLDPYSKSERGLVFMALNANIAEQFEVIQRWCAQGNSTGDFSGHADPLLGVAKAGQKRTLRFMDKGKVYRSDMNTSCQDEPVQFVTLRWGIYSFIPSVSAVQKISKYLEHNQENSDINALDFGYPKPRGISVANYGKFVMTKLPDVTSMWKVALEDASARGAGITEGIWAEIERDKGARRTTYGVLVAKPELVEEVLLNPDNNFSVRMYNQRLNDTHIGDGYIGMDPQPVKQSGATGADKELDEGYRAAVEQGRYEIESKAFNKRISAAKEQPAFHEAYASSNRFFDLEEAKPDVGTAIEISMESFIDCVLADLSSKWFGIPLASQLPEEANTAQEFSSVAGYIFNAHPSSYVEQRGRADGQQLKCAGYAYYDAQKSGEADSTIAGDLYRSTIGNGDEGIKNREDFVRTLVGVAQGFSGPTRGTFLSVIATLIQTEELWRLQTILVDKLTDTEEMSYDLVQETLLSTLQSAMQLRPVPEMVFRKAVRDCQIGKTKIKSGENVVISLKRASSKDFYMLFGGDYESSNKTQHACPGRRLAIGTLLGMLCAILTRGILEPAANPLLIGLKKRN